MTLSALLCPFLLALPAEDVVHTTRHYRLVVDGTPEEAEQAGVVLELAREQLKKIFRAEPPRNRDGLPTVRFLQDRETWLASIRACGVEPPAGADLVHYLPEQDIVFIHGGESAYARRALLLHGATQQFHCKAKPKNRDLVRTWLTMGLADHLSMHTWDGKVLTLGVLPIVCNEDIFGRARDALTAADFDPRALFVDGIAQPEICMVLVRYLLDETKPSRRKKFTKLGLGYTGSKLHPETYARMLGAPEQLSDELIEWIDDHQLTLQTLSGLWEDRGHGGLLADALGGAQARAQFKSTPVQLSVALRPDESLGATPGLTFTEAATGNEWSLLVLPEELLVIGVLAEGRRYERAIPHSTRDGRSVRIDLKREGGELTILANRKEIERLELDITSISLVVQGGSALFEGLHWR